MKRSLKSKLRTNAFLRSAKSHLSILLYFNKTPHKSIMKFLSPSPVKTILDVGANIGQFGIDMRRHGFIGEIVSFEPVSEI